MPSNFFMYLAMTSSRKKLFAAIVVIFTHLIIPSVSLSSNVESLSLGFVENLNQDVAFRASSVPGIAIGSKVTNQLPETTTLSYNLSSSTNSVAPSNERYFHVQIAAIHVDKAEFPLSRLLFKLTLRSALESVERKLASQRIKISINVRSANTCSRQYAAAVAAEEFYTRRARLFIVSGCDDAIRAVSRLATGWQVPVMTAAGFGLELNDKSVHKTLVRVAFSLQAAVEFLFKIMKIFQWRRFNLIVDESDTNCLALKGTIEKQILTFESSNGTELYYSTFSLNLKDLASLSQFDLLNNETSPANNGSLAIDYKTIGVNTITNVDRWPNERTEHAVRDALIQSSMFSRINVLLLPQTQIRRFMLSAYDQGMANGLYTFITIPLLLVTNEDQMDDTSASGVSNVNKQSYTMTTGENVYLWRAHLSSRNLHAKQAYESLMSINLKSPTTKAYMYFASKLANVANTEYATTTTTQASVSKNITSKQAATSKIRLNINPYLASFYDCIQIYSTVLVEKLQAIETERSPKFRQRLMTDFHGKISEAVRDRRFDNMLTGTISINMNGDRDTDYTLDDMNQMTNKFVPVILYRGNTKELERLSRIQWSSDATVGQTTDDVDCNLTGSCASKPIPKFLVTLFGLAAPLIIITFLVLYYVYKRIHLESQLVDYWWRIDIRDIELVATRRKIQAGTSSFVGWTESQAESSLGYKPSNLGSESNKLPATERNHETGLSSGVGRTTITKVTDNSGFNSSAADVCYGDIILGIYKLNKVALRPITEFHQSRKMMIEIRSLKEINHNNLCRFVGIVLEDANRSIVSEYCSKGSLREFFQSESLVIDWTFRYSIINDIVAGLMYLHSSALQFHGRLKSSNCLVSSRFVVKLSDYGPHSLYEQLDDNQDEESLLMKQIWAAPELIKSNCKSGSEKGDVYSFGLLLYEIITNNTPFYDPSKSEYTTDLKTLHNELKLRGPNEKIGPDMSAIVESDEDINSLIDLMKSCWSYDVNKRPSLVVVNTAIKKITKGVTSKKLLENLTTRMEQYTNNLESLVDAKLATLVEEKQKTDELLYQFVPKSIASLLKEGQTIEPEAFECVTVFYSDIVGFTSLSSESSPMEVIDFLSDLYLCFDETLENHDIFKVDTIGDAYIVASGLPQRNDGKHVIEIACAALELRERLATFKIAHRPNKTLEMRVGIHSGPCIAGIVGGSSMPKYCVFGETLTIGKFMEGSGLPMKIHITEQSKDLLAGIASFIIEPRQPKISRDGLPFQTYWLERS